MSQWGWNPGLCHSRFLAVLVLRVLFQGCGQVGGLADGGCVWTGAGRGSSFLAGVHPTHSTTQRARPGVAGPPRNPSHDDKLIFSTACFEAFFHKENSPVAPVAFSKQSQMCSRKHLVPAVTKSHLIISISIELWNLASVFHICCLRCLSKQFCWIDIARIIRVNPYRWRKWGSKVKGLSQRHHWSEN